MNTPSIASFLISIHLTDGNAISPALKTIGRRLQVERVHHEKVRGEELYSHAHNCSIEGLLKRVAGLDYRLVSAVYFERTDPKSTHHNKTEHVVRFEFIKDVLADNIAVVPQDAVEVLLAELDRLCNQALYRLRGFRNPFYNRAGELVSGQSTVSIDLDAAVPLLRPDGKPNKVFPKDANGHACGFPKPIKAEHKLSVLSLPGSVDQLCLTTEK